MLMFAEKCFTNSKPLSGERLANTCAAMFDLSCCRLDRSGHVITSTDVTKESLFMARVQWKGDNSFDIFNFTSTAVFHRKRDFSSRDHVGGQVRCKPSVPVMVAHLRRVAVENVLSAIVSGIKDWLSWARLNY